MSQPFDANRDSDSEPHVVRRLGVIAREHGDGLVGELRIRPDLRAPETGLPLLGPLGSFCDTIGGVFASIGVYPTPIATADLTIALDPRVAPEIVRTQPAIVRAGRTAVITEMRLVDVSTGRPCGYCSMSSAVLTTARPQSVDPRVVTQFFNAEYEPRAAYFYDEIGIVDEGNGRVVLELVPFLGNSMGMMHGGVTVMLAEAAALSAARSMFGREPAAGDGAPAGERLVALDAQVRYLNGARVGPVVATGEIVAAATNWVSVLVAQYDEGGRRPTSTALVRVDRSA